MSDIETYEELSDGGFLSWKDIGQRVRGKFMGLEPGKFGQNVKLVTDQGLVAFGRTSAMKVVDAMQKGDDVEFVFTGTKPSKYASPTKLFRIRRFKQDEVPF